MPRLRSQIIGLLTVLFACALAPSLTLAQTVAQNRPEEQPGREIQGTTEAQRAAAASESLLGQGGPPITYDEVLARPDDVDLNYRYAVQQAQSGDVRGAATTLERILLVDPNLPQVRLLYAIVLFRLDSLEEAKREFASVRQMPIGDDVRAEIDRYLAQIDQRQKLNRFVASLSLGGDFNTNRNFQPRSDTRLFQDIPGSTLKGGQHDFGRLAIGSFEAHHDLQTQERDELLFRSTLFYDNQVQVKTQDLRAGAFEAGSVLRRDIATFTPTITFTDVELANHHFLMAPGAKLLTERKIDARIDGYVLLQVDHQHFFDNPVAITSVSQSGWRYNAQVGASYTLNPTMQIGASYRHTINRAIQSFDSFDTDEIGASYTWLLGKGQFLLANATWGSDRYDTADRFDLSANGNDISAATRRDGIARARLTYGTPLDTISTSLGGPNLPDKLADIVLTVSVEGTWAQSNITNFAYTNYKTEMLLTKRWEF